MRDDLQSLTNLFEIYSNDRVLTSTVADAESKFFLKKETQNSLSAESFGVATSSACAM